MKDRCFLGKRDLFIRSCVVDQYNLNIAPDIEAKATITQVGKHAGGADCHFKLHWTNLPSCVLRHHVRQTLPRSYYEEIKALRVQYDEAHPSESAGKKRKRKPRARAKKSPVPSTNKNSPPSRAVAGAARAAADKTSPLGLAPSPERRASRRVQNLTPDSEGESESDDGSDLDGEDDQYNFAFGTQFGSLDPFTTEEGIHKDLDPNLSPFDVEESNSRDITWHFECVDDVEDFSIKIPECVGAKYNEKPRLRDGVGNSFSTPLQAVEKCGGLNRQFVRRLTATSNEYVQRNA